MPLSFPHRSRIPLLSFCIDFVTHVRTSKHIHVRLVAHPFCSSFVLPLFFFFSPFLCLMLSIEFALIGLPCRLCCLPDATMMTPHVHLIPSPSRSTRSLLFRPRSCVPRSKDPRIMSAFPKLRLLTCTSSSTTCTRITSLCQPHRVTPSALHPTLLPLTRFSSVRPACRVLRPLHRSARPDPGPCCPVHGKRCIVSCSKRAWTCCHVTRTECAPLFRVKINWQTS